MSVNYTSLSDRYYKCYLLEVCAAIFKLVCFGWSKGTETMKVHMEKKGV